MSDEKKANCYYQTVQFNGFRGRVFCRRRQCPAERFSCSEYGRKSWVLRNGIRKNGSCEVVYENGVAKKVVKDYHLICTSECWGTSAGWSMETQNWCYIVDEYTPPSILESGGFIRFWSAKFGNGKSVRKSRWHCFHCRRRSILADVTWCEDERQSIYFGTERSLCQL